MNSSIREELLNLIKNDNEIADAIKGLFDNTNNKNNTSIINDNQISALKKQLEDEKKERIIVDNLMRVLQKQLDDKKIEMDNIIKEKDSEYEKLNNKYKKTLKDYDKCKSDRENIESEFIELRAKYKDIDLIYSKYLSLGPGIIEKLERVLNKEKNPSNTAELFFAYGIQESNIVALWESIATNIDYYNSEGKTKTLIEIFEYFIELYSEVAFKDVIIYRPNVGDLYDERIHTRTNLSNAVGHIQEVILPGFSIGKNINKKSFVSVK